MRAQLFRNDTSLVLL